MPDTPEHLRLFASLATEDAAHWRRQAELYPQRRAEYLAKAEQREDDARFYLGKADRDEAWNAPTEDYTLEAAE
jgi:hypothetical protein